MCYFCSSNYSDRERFPIFRHRPPCSLEEPFNITCTVHRGLCAVNLWTYRSRCDRNVACCVCVLMSNYEYAVTFVCVCEVVFSLRIKSWAGAVRVCLWCSLRVWISLRCKGHASRWDRPLINCVEKTDHVKLLLSAFSLLTMTLALLFFTLATCPIFTAPIPHSSCIPPCPSHPSFISWPVTSSSHLFGGYPSIPLPL